LTARPLAGESGGDRSAAGAHVHLLNHLFGSLGRGGPSADVARRRSARRSPQHKSAWPAIVSGANPAEMSASLDLGPTSSAAARRAMELAEHRRSTKALAALAPQRKGVVDAYVVSIGLDSDPVFGREAREAGKVLSRRFDAAGRTLVLAGSDGRGPSRLPMGSLHSLASRWRGSPS
jgi:hypothetical protein